MYGCELWSLNDSRPINEFCVAWQKALRRVINVPNNFTVAFYRYSQTLFLSLMNYASDHLSSFCPAFFRGSPLVHAVANHALQIARYNSVIGSNALFCCARYGWTAADLLAGKIHVSNSYFQKICDNWLSRSEICVAQSLFEVLCVREGELYLPHSFLQLYEINEIISALCTVSL